MDRKVYLTGLFISCPLKKAQIECPFRKFRNAPIDKIIPYRNALKDREVLQLAGYHKRCMLTKKNVKKAILLVG